MYPMSEKLKKELKGFIFPQVPVEEWLLNNDMKCGPLPCSKCGMELHPLIPIASKRDRGVCYQPCECGESPPVSLVSACPKEREGDKRFFQLLSKSLQD